MKLRYAIFATSASLTPDGLFSLLGGGIQWVNASSVPASMPNLCLVARLEVEPSECNKPKECIVKVTDPDGNRLSPDLTVMVNSSLDKVHPGQSVDFTAHYGYNGFIFNRVGIYRFCITIGDTSLGEATIELRERLQT